ncbi:MAG TPA: hypothetical protein VHY32_12260 [Caulobacteraceae bacterium]|jgi:hypothetical protein|nr:hypothetical protein [Caulobacteraceae bacterium]
MMLRTDDYLQRAKEAERWADAETRQDIQALFLKSAESWRALAAVAQLSEELLTTEFD